MFDALSHEVKDLILNLIILEQRLLAHSKTLRHANLPFDLIYSKEIEKVKVGMLYSKLNVIEHTWKEDLVLSTIVLETAWGLPSRGLGSVEQEGQVLVELCLSRFANALVKCEQALHVVCCLFI